jgi:hypothetical protein
MSSRIIWVSAAVLVAVLLVPVSMSAYYDWQSVCHGSLVIVRVTDLPKSSSGDLKFSYNGQVYDKDVPNNVHLNLNVGDSIQLKYSNAAENRRRSSYLEKKSPRRSRTILGVHWQGSI